MHGIGFIQLYSLNQIFFFHFYFVLFCVWIWCNFCCNLSMWKMWCSWNIKQVLLKCISNSFTDFTDSCTSIVKSTNATLSYGPVLMSFIVFAKCNPNERFLLVSNFCKEICCLGHIFLFCNWPLKVFFCILWLWIVYNDLIKHLEWTQLFVYVF